MKIGYYSDLHIDTHSERSCLEPLLFAVKNYDVVVIAGDISNCIVESLAFMLDLAIRTPSTNFVFVLGNHEYYSRSYDIVQGIIYKFIDSNETSNLHILDNSYIYINDYMFIGGTCWSDFNCRNSKSMTTAAYCMNDFNYIADFSPIDCVELHNEFLKFFQSTVNRNSKCKKIIVTHHAPSFLSISPNFAHSYKINGAYASNLESLIEEANPVLWIHGHVHDSFNYELYNTTVKCNPRGAGKGNKNFTYFPK